MPPLPPLVKILMLLNVGLFCLDEILDRALTSMFGLWPVGSSFFMPWQIVTYAFLHGGIVHLAFNMLGLWMFGAHLESLWGSKRFGQFYAASVFAGAVVHAMVGALIGARYVVIGASGGLFGMLLAYGMLFPNRMFMLLIPPIPMKAKTMAAVFGGMELFFGVTGTLPGIAHFAHLGGMLGGFLMIRYWRGQPPFGGRRRF